MPARLQSVSRALLAPYCRAPARLLLRPLPVQLHRRVTMAAAVAASSSSATAADAKSTAVQGVPQTRPRSSISWGTHNSAATSGAAASSATTAATPSGEKAPPTSAGSLTAAPVPSGGIGQSKNARRKAERAAAQAAARPLKRKAERERAKERRHNKRAALSAEELARVESEQRASGLRLKARREELAALTSALRLRCAPHLRGVAELLTSASASSSSSPAAAAPAADSLQSGAAPTPPALTAAAAKRPSSSAAPSTAAGGVSDGFDAAAFWSDAKLTPRPFVAIDCGYDHLMVEREVSSLALQLQQIHSVNLRVPLALPLILSDLTVPAAKHSTGSAVSPAAHPAGPTGASVASAASAAAPAHSDDGVCDVSEVKGSIAHGSGVGSTSLLQCLSKVNGLASWPMSGTTAPITSVFPMPRVVVLCAESDTVLHSLAADTVYVIGGMVDHNRLKGTLHGRARALGLATARLPIDEHLHGGTRNVLTVNQVFHILAEFAHCRDWRTALMAALPQRWKWQRNDTAAAAKRTHVPAQKQHSAAADSSASSAVGGAPSASQAPAAAATL